MDLSLFEATGVDDPTYQISISEWNSFLNVLESSSTPGLSVVPLRTTLKSLTGQTDGDAKYLSEEFRSGLFEFDSSNLATLVAADTAEGIYVAPNSDTTGASGAWVRHVPSDVDPRWFGIRHGRTLGYGPANSAAISVMFATLIARVNVASTNYRSCEPILFPTGYFDFSSTIEFTGAAFIFRGTANGQTGYGTHFKFPAGVTGLRTQSTNTSGATTTDGVVHKGAAGTIIENLSIQGGFSLASPVEAEAHGIQLRTITFISNVAIDSFEGDGIFAWTTSGSATREGNANTSHINHFNISYCRNGIFFNGADVNICSVSHGTVGSCRAWGIADESFLGNHWEAIHCKFNGGEASFGTTPNIVTYLGNRFSVKYGEEAWASTNAPAATAIDNQGWIFRAVGGVDAGDNINTWVSGTTYRPGGSFLASGGRSTFVGCYHEGGQGVPQIYSNAMMLGGQISVIYGSGGRLEVLDGSFVSNIPFAAPTFVSNRNKIGYTTGSGGTVTQLTNKSTGVTLNKPSGQITMNNASLDGGASVIFLFTNSELTNPSTLLIQMRTGTGTNDAYEITVNSVGTGTARIKVTNLTGGALGEALVLNFNVIGGSTT